MNSVSSPAIGTPNQTVVLAPSFWVPMGVGGVALPGFWLQTWLGGILLVLAIFLAIQALTLRLHFTPAAMELYRGEQQLRRFPYQDWLNWQIFWPPVPILFYFREVKSIHFTPMLFNADQLQTCLEQYCPQPGA